MKKIEGEALRTEGKKRHKDVPGMRSCASSQLIQRARLNIHKHPLRHVNSLALLQWPMLCGAAHFGC